MAFTDTHDQKLIYIYVYEICAWWQWKHIHWICMFFSTGSLDLLVSALHGKEKSQSEDVN